MRCLKVTIELPGFFVGDEDTSEDVEEAMALDGTQAVVTFIGFEGDSPQRFLRVLEGTLIDVGIEEYARDLHGATT